MTSKNTSHQSKIVLDLVDIVRELPDDRLQKVLDYAQDLLEGYHEVVRREQRKSRGELYFPASLAPDKDAPAEKAYIDVSEGFPRYVIPDRDYPRGWEEDCSAFYFPMSSPCSNDDLHRILVALGLWDTLSGKLPEMKFRSGVIFKTPDHCTPGQLEELRDAASILLYGYRGFHIRRGHEPLTTLGSSVAFFSQYSAFLTGVLNKTTKGKVGKYPSLNKDLPEIWKRLSFRKGDLRNCTFRPVRQITHGTTWWEPVLATIPF